MGVVRNDRCHISESINHLAVWEQVKKLTKKNIEAQRRGAIVHIYENIEIVEIDGIKRVRHKKTGEVMPMRNRKRMIRGISK